jgi:hypothetical protein
MVCQPVVDLCADFVALPCGVPLEVASRASSLEERERSVTILRLCFLSLFATGSYSWREVDSIAFFSMSLSPESAHERQKKGRSDAGLQAALSRGLHGHKRSVSHSGFSPRYRVARKRKARQSTRISFHGRLILAYSISKGKCGYLGAQPLPASETLESPLISLLTSRFYVPT